MACSPNRESKPHPRTRKLGFTSIERKQQLAAAIDCLGIVSRTACGSCVHHEEVECRVGVCSGRCSHCSDCTRHGRKCNFIVTRQELCRQIENIDRDLKELLQKRVELRQRWDALEDRAGNAMVQEQANIEQLERLETTVSIAAPETPDILESVIVLDFLQQDFIVHSTSPKDAQSYTNLDSFHPNSPMNFDPGLEIRF